MNTAKEEILRRLVHYNLFIHSHWAEYDTPHFKLTEAGEFVLNLLAKSIGPFGDQLWNKIKEKGLERDDEQPKLLLKKRFIEIKGVQKAKQHFEDRLDKAGDGVMDVFHDKVQEYGKEKLAEELKANKERLMALIGIGLDVMSVYSRQVLHNLILVVAPEHTQLILEAFGQIGLSYAADYAKALREMVLVRLDEHMDESIEEFVNKFGDSVIEAVTKYFRDGEELQKCTL